MREVVMPKASMTMTEGELMHWMLSDGSEVTEGDPIAEIMTDKVDMEVEAPSDGRLGILVEEGVSVPVGTVIGVILAPGESKPDGAVSSPTPSVEEVPEQTSAPLDSRAEATSAHAASTGSLRALPAARAMAKRLKVDLSRVRGTGPGGRIKPEDVVAFNESAVLKDEAEGNGLSVRSRGRPTGVRGAMAHHMAAAALIPQFTVFAPVSFAAAELARREVAETWGLRVGVTDLILRAVALALQDHPDLNAHFIDGEIVRYENVNLGIATETDSGLIVPVLKGAESLDMRTSVERTADLVMKARSGKLQLENATGATFTVTNLGMFGVESFQPVVDPPQVAILSVGRLHDDAGRTTTLGLAADHRVLDGAQAARFLQRTCRLLERPDRELIPPQRA